MLHAQRSRESRERDIAGVGARHRLARQLSGDACVAPTAPAENAMESITETVRSKYADAARRAAAGEQATCGCDNNPAACCDPITSNLYGDDEAATLPDAALRASLGCGNPTAL